jgi:hypothetical protein
MEAGSTFLAVMMITGRAFVRGLVMLVVGSSATGTTVGKLGMVDVMPGLDCPVEGLCRWSVLWRLEV